MIFHVPSSLALLSLHLKKKQSHPLVFTDRLQERKPSVSLIRDSEVFSNPFYGYTCSILLVLFCGGILKIVCLLHILHSQVKY